MKTTLLSLFVFLSVIVSGCSTTKPLTIDTRPSGARVRVTDQRGRVNTGTTPARFDLSPRGEYQIEIYKKGYEPVELVGSAYAKPDLTIKNAANTALVFISPPVGLVWGGARYMTGDFKSFDKVMIQLEPLQSQQVSDREVVDHQPPVKKREILENQPRPRNTEIIEIEVEIREFEREFENPPRTKRRHISKPQEDDED